MRDLLTGAEQAWAVILTFLPKLLMFLVILVAGYFISKWIGKLLDAILERVGFDRMVERGGIKRVLDKTNYDASDLMCKIAFYTVFLLVLQLAFGVFGPNPISDILTRVIAFLPTLFVAMLIVIVTAAIAKGVKDILQAVLGGLSYGPMLARLASAAIVITGVFAALSHLNIAPAIVNGLFYTGLAIIAGSAIIAIGGGGIVPMRQEWERALGRLRQEAPKIKSELANAPANAPQPLEGWPEQESTASEAYEARRAAGANAPKGVQGTKRYEPRERSRPPQ
ncbi:MAG: hypothetical protein AB1813_08610 [Verrucomicrobiota bacterium]|jgi:hypothetical protein